MNKGFSFVSYIALTESCSITQAINIARDYKDGVEGADLQYYNPVRTTYPPTSMSFEELMEIVNKGGRNSEEYTHLIQHGLKYLTDKRGLTLEQIVDFQLGITIGTLEVAGKKFNLYGHIVVPIMLHGNVISYTSRTMEINGLKVSPIKFHHALAEEDYYTISEVLFNLENAIRAARKRGILILFEDAWSSIKMSGCGLLGSNLTDEQVIILKANWEGPIVICLDNDVGGQAAAKNIQTKLFRCGFSDVRNVIPPIGIDPDDDIVTTMEAILKSKPETDNFSSQLLAKLR